MYIDFIKFDYEAFNISNYQELENRDKDFYKKILSDWFNGNLNKIVDRKWDIDDIGFVEKTSDFIKLIKEAELAYSMGLYTSSIALIGISSEDLTRYFSFLSGHEFDNLSQFHRINKLFELELISEVVKNKLHEIRTIRNDCLHYNQDFKTKNKEILQVDSLKVINLLKSIYSLLFINDIESDEVFTYDKVLQQLSHEVAYQNNVGDTVSQDEITLKLRNSFAQFTGIDMSINSNYLELNSIYTINEIDLDIEPKEMTLYDELRKLPFIIDLNSNDIERIEKDSISEGSKIVAIVSSQTNELGMTAEWKFKEWRKV